MTRRTSKPEPAKSDVQVTPEEGKIENLPSTPVNLEVETPSVEPVPAATPDVEKIQSDIRQKLSTKNLEENIFVPSNPAALEKAAEQVAKENNFDLTRGTSIGARLMARSQKRV